MTVKATRGELTRHRLPIGLLAIFLLVWTGLAFQPWYRADWALENVLIVVGVPMLVRGYRNLRLSNACYVLVFVFLCLHEVGAHYTYAKVPFAVGWFGGERNHYDRVVHFSFGLLMLPVMVEVFQARAKLVGIWRFVVPVTFLMALSEVFEMGEAVAAEVFGGNLGQSFLGSQGDIWDAQKDSAMAMFGAMLTMALLRAFGARRPFGLPAP